MFVYAPLRVQVVYLRNYVENRRKNLARVKFHSKVQTGASNREHFIASFIPPLYIMRRIQQAAYVIVILSFHSFYMSHYSFCVLRYYWIASTHHYLLPFLQQQQFSSTLFFVLWTATILCRSERVSTNCTKLIKPTCQKQITKKLW